MKKLSFYPKRKLGFTLIELMIALVIGVILVLGIASIFVNTSNNIRLQRGISNLQESGREALTRLVDDAAATGSQYCTAVGVQSPRNGFTPQKVVRNFATTTTSGTAGGLFFGLPGSADTAVTTATNPAGPPYNINPRFFLQGHDCVANTCTPALTVLGGNPGVVPAAGTAAGDRVPNSDVLTVRYLQGNGASLSSSSVAAGGNISFPLNANYAVPGSGGLLRLGLAPPSLNRLFMVADCSKAAIFRGDFSAAGATALVGGNAGLADAPSFRAEENARVFDLRNNFLTVTYFLQNIADPNVVGRLIPTLMRSENGATEEVVRGVERLDFRYSVARFRADFNNPSYQGYQWMTANQVHTAIPCPPRPKGIPGFDNFVPLVPELPLTTDTELGCNWRGVGAIEIGMLVTSVDDVPNAETTETYSMDAGAVVTPATGRLIRREFRAIAPIKAWVQ